PLHGMHAASIGAAGDDAEIGARLLKHVHVKVGLGGGLLDVGDPFRPTGELVLEELLRACPTVGLRAPDRGRGHGFTGLAAGLGGEILAGVDHGALLTPAPWRRRSARRRDWP